MLPALLASWLSLSMASISSLGGWPKRSADLTIIMNFMVTSPLLLVFIRSRVFRGGRRLNLGSTEASNERQRNRHERHHLLIPQCVRAHRVARRLGLCGRIGARILT